MLKKKIPAVFQPDGQTMKTMKISRFNIHPCVNESMIEIRVKSGLSMKKNQFFIEKSKVSMPPFGNDIDTALMDLDKVQMFCTKLDLCGKSQKARIDGLMVDKKKLEDRIESIKKKIDELVKELKKDKGELPIKIAEKAEEIKDG